MGEEELIWWRRPGIIRLASALYNHDGNDAPPPSQVATKERMFDSKTLPMRPPSRKMSKRQTPNSIMVHTSKKQLPILYHLL